MTIKSCKELQKELDETTNPVTRSSLLQAMANRAVRIEQESNEWEAIAGFFESECVRIAHEYDRDIDNMLGDTNSYTQDVVTFKCAGYDVVKVARIKQYIKKIKNKKVRVSKK